MSQGQTRRQVLTTWSAGAGAILIGGIIGSPRVALAEATDVAGFTRARSETYATLLADVAAIDPRIDLSQLDMAVAQFERVYTAASEFQALRNAVLDEVALRSSSGTGFSRGRMVRVLRDWLYLPPSATDRYDGTMLQSMALEGLTMAVLPFSDPLYPTPPAVPT